MQAVFGRAKWLNPIRAFAWLAVQFYIWWLRRRLGTGLVAAFAAFVELAVFFAILMIVLDVIVIPAGTVGLLFVLDWTLGSWAEWVVLLVILFYAAWAVRAGQFWLEWTPWATRQRVHRPDPDSEAPIDYLAGAYRLALSRLAPVVDAYRALLMLTAAFAALTAILAAHGWLDPSPETDNAHLAWEAVAYYSWHFFDAIPVLEVPQTLNWNLGTDFTDHVSGALLLVFKLLVIIPVVRAVMKLVRPDVSQEGKADEP